jgi:hypothetical protein
VTARVRTDAVRNLRHQHRDLHQSTYPVPLRRSGLNLLSDCPKRKKFDSSNKGFHNKKNRFGEEEEVEVLEDHVSSVFYPERF